MEPGPATDPATDPAGRWRGRLSLYSAEINDLTMDLHLRADGDERGGRAEIEITDEPGELHHFVTDLWWAAEGAAIVIHIGRDGTGDASGLTFSGKRVGPDRMDGRLNGWGIKNAAISLQRGP